jgi:hypothetical protein
MSTLQNESPGRRSSLDHPWLGTPVHVKYDV